MYLGINEKPGYVIQNLVKTTTDRSWDIERISTEPIDWWSNQNTTKQIQNSGKEWTDGKTTKREL